MLNRQIIEQDLDAIISSGIPFDRFAGKTILVTGANGFLPAYLVETILRLNSTHKGLNAHVLALVRNRKKAEQRFYSYLQSDRGDLTLLVQDVNAPILWDGDIDFIFHAASQASPKYYGSDPVGTALPNILGTNNLLQLATTKKTKGFVYFSSSEVYGNVPSDLIPIEETTFGPLDPYLLRSCYAESKRMGETLCISWAHQFGVPAQIVRPFHTYGPGMQLDDGRVFSDFVADIISGRDIQMKSDGSAIRAYCYLADAARAFFTVLLKGVPGNAYNVGNASAAVSVLELAQILVALYPEKRLQVIQKREIDNTNYLKSTVQKNVPNTIKLQKLGWEPKFDLRDGFERTIRSFI